MDGKGQSEQYDAVKRLLIERFAVDESQITPQAELQEALALDSLDALDLLFAVNETFRTQIPEQVLESVHTVDDLVRVIQQYTKKK